MWNYRFCSIMLLVCLTSVARGQEYRAELRAEPPHVPAMAPAWAEQFSTTGYQVLLGASRTLCEIWPCKQWDVPPDFQPSPTRWYPFSPGQLVGVVHFPRRAADFRDQKLAKGWYTLRFGLQPIDGNHVGTSPTRDFLLLVPAEDDTSTQPMDMDQLIALSTKASGSSHPAMLCLKPTDGPVDDAGAAKVNTNQKYSMHHDAERDWWHFQFTGQGIAEGQPRDIILNMVIAGHAQE